MLERLCVASEPHLGKTKMKLSKNTQEMWESQLRKSTDQMELEKKLKAFHEISEFFHQNLIFTDFSLALISFSIYKHPAALDLIKSTVLSLPQHFMEIDDYDLDLSGCLLIPCTPDISTYKGKKFLCRYKYVSFNVNTFFF